MNSMDKMDKVFKKLNKAKEIYEQSKENALKKALEIIELDNISICLRKLTEYYAEDHDQFDSPYYNFVKVSKDFNKIIMNYDKITITIDTMRDIGFYELLYPFINKCFDIDVSNFKDYEVESDRGPFSRKLYVIVINKINNKWEIDICR